MIGLVCISLPIKQVSNTIFARVTGRNYKLMTIDNFIDILLFASFIWWIEEYIRLKYLPTKEGELETGLMQNIIDTFDEDNKLTFNMDTILAIVGGFFWLRVFFMLKYT